MPKIEANVQVEINPSRLAVVFWRMSSFEQADFFFQLSKFGTKQEKELRWTSLFTEVGRCPESEKIKEEILELAAPFLHEVLDAHLDI